MISERDHFNSILTLAGTFTGTLGGLINGELLYIGNVIIGAIVGSVVGYVTTLLMKKLNPWLTKIFRLK